MWDAVAIGRTVLASVLLSQLIVLALRLPSCASRKELAEFSLFLILLGLRNSIFTLTLARLFVSLSLIWASGNYIITVSGRGRAIAWNLAAAALLAVSILVNGIGFSRTLPFSLFFHFSEGMLSLYPLWLLYAHCRSTRSPLFFYILLVSVLLLAAGAADSVSAISGFAELNITLWISLLLIAGTGYMIFQEGYLSGTGLQGYAARMDKQEKLAQDAYTRALRTENALLLQDRLVALGLLAAGAAHEFKNSLASIKAAAQYGLSRDDPRDKQTSLRMLLEQAELGRESVVDLLEKLALQGREVARKVNFKDETKQLLRIVRSTYRTEGIRFSVESEDGLVINVRQGELEQILLNLVRNAVDALRKREGDVKREMSVKAWRSDGSAVIDVMDNGGGVPAEIAPVLFQPSLSGSGSTGLGLYLSRSLAVRNGGNLEYLPAEGGSCFRLTFPLDG